MRVRLAAGALALAFALAGCAALPWPSGAGRGTGVARSNGLLDLRGAVHVHTRVSHDSQGSIGEVIDAARGAGLAWIAFAEHSRRARLGPPEGRVEGVTLIPGWELRVRGGSILALGVPNRDGLPRGEVRALVEAIHARGGAAFVGHMERSSPADLERFAAAGADGVELVNLHASALHARFRLALGTLFLPGPLAWRPLLREPVENLSAWARLAGAGAIVGGVDAHAKFRLLGPLGGTFDRYRDLFRLLTTHVRATDRSAPAILEALRAGRSYVAFEGLERVDRFEFERVEGALHVRAPREAGLALVCAGAPVESANAREASFRLPADARACHVEARLGKRLWIVTSRVQ